MSLRERLGDLFFNFLPYAIGALLIAGIVHIVSILLMPNVAPRDAFARFSELVPQSRMSLLPTPKPGSEAIPYQDPALIQAACRYDLADSPLHIRANVSGDGLLSLAFHSRSGRIFYSMTDRAALRGKIDVILLTKSQLTALEALDTDDEPPQELRLVSPSREGFVIVRALAERENARPEALGRLAAVSCAPEARR